MLANERFNAHSRVPNTHQHPRTKTCMDYVGSTPPPPPGARPRYRQSIGGGRGVEVGGGEKERKPPSFSQEGEKYTHTHVCMYVCSSFFSHSVHNTSRRPASAACPTTTLRERTETKRKLRYYCCAGICKAGVHLPTIPVFLIPDYPCRSFCLCPPRIIESRRWICSTNTQHKRNVHPRGKDMPPRASRAWARAGRGVQGERRAGGGGRTPQN